MTFEPPPSARLTDIEWPPGSGRWASYSGKEREFMRRLAARLETMKHRDGCAAAAAETDPARRFDADLRDLEGCERCQVLNELEFMHELKVVFQVDIA